MSGKAIVHFVFHFKFKILRNFESCIEHDDIETVMIET